MAVLLWAFLKGLAILLVSGALLALAAVLLPRLLAWWERREAARLGLEAVSPAPALPAREKPLAAAAAPGPAAPAPPSSLAPGAPLEEPLVAAAIGLALTLYQEEQKGSPVSLRPEGPSPWALAGRWEIMARRLNLPKR